MTLAPDIDKPILTPIYAYDQEGYLIGDGLPMAETEAHRREMVNCIESLSAYFANAVDVVVSGNNFIHYKAGDRNRHISPDCYVVKGVPKRLRDNYKIWEEGDHKPCVIFEFTSEDTRHEDTGRKFTLYEQVLQTSEYYLFDPKSEYLNPPFQGYSLQTGQYEAMLPDAQGRLWSAELGLWLEIVDGMLRFFDPVQGEYLRTPAEAEHERLIEKQKALAERQRADAEAQARANAERMAVNEAQRANQEATARAQAEAELERLRAELDALRRGAL